MTVTLAYLQGLVPALGWTLAHFLWQGAVVAFALQVALKACRTSRTRHDLALAALVLMAVLPVATFAWLQSGVRIVLVPRGFPGLTPAGQQWETFAVGAWLAGVAILAARLAGGLVLVERLRRTAQALPPDWIVRCRRLEQRIVLPLKAAFAQSEAVATPVVAGWLKPIVLIPASFLARMPAAELEALILHELAHVRRLDAFANLIQSVVETVLFYHPAVWWVSRRVRVEREQCCDDQAAAILRDPALYVRALQSLDALRASPYGVLAANGGDLKRRAARILGLAIAPERPALSRSAAVAILALGAAAMTHGATVQAEPTPTPTTPMPTAMAPTPVAALKPLVERSAPAPAVAAAPRIVLAAADVATPTPLTAPPALPSTPALVADPPLRTPTAPLPAPAVAAKAQPVSYGATVVPLVVSPIKPLEPDLRIDAARFHGGVPWPHDALSEGFDGHVVLRCDIDVHGLAERCAVQSESPAGKSFGAAALEIRPSLKLAPAQGPDGPVASTRIIAVDFERTRLPTFAQIGAVCANSGEDSKGLSCGGVAGISADGVVGGALAGGRAVTLLDNPQWVRAASFDDLAAVYPTAGHGEGGYVVDHCAVRRDGFLEGCRVVTETPEGRGFARAALALAHRFQVSPKQATDPRAGRSLWVDLPIRFPSAREMADRAVTAPRWTRGFDLDMAPAVYPPEAVTAGVTSGRGVARCTVGPDGALTGCIAEGGEPGGLGFSAAAAKLASTMKMNLWSADGAPVEGGVVQIPIRLNLKGG